MHERVRASNNCIHRVGSSRFGDDALAGDSPFRTRESRNFTVYTPLPRAVTLSPREPALQAQRR